MNKVSIKTMVFLHLMLMVYSMSGICSKLASGQSFLNIKFCIYYGLIIVLLGFYAIGWQQIIKRMPLIAAYANRAVTVVWGLVWGTLLFNEKITMGKIAGVSLVVLGVVIFAQSDEEVKNE